MRDGDRKTDGATPDGRPRLARTQSKLEDYELMMGSGSPRSSPGIATGVESDITAPTSSAVLSDKELEDADEKEMFSRIKKPRVRYDVEVVTKLIVYSGMRFIHRVPVYILRETGIAWLTIYGSPLMFDVVGLGLRTAPGP